MSGAMEGKVVLITGAAKNIGRATALAFAADGATVAVNALYSRAEGESLVKEIKNTGGQAGLFIANIADAAAVKSMVKDIVGQFGRLDVLVLNASHRDNVHFIDLSYEQWRHVMALTLDWAFFCIKNCLPHMIKAGGGSIVMLGGANALAGAADKVHGSVAKHGLVGMTRALAKDLAQYGVRVNCVSPGPIDTLRDARRGPKPPVSPNVLLGRRGEPGDIASMVHFLCGPKGAFITGQTMHVNGGVLLGS